MATSHEAALRELTIAIQNANPDNHPDTAERSAQIAAELLRRFTFAKVAS